MGEKGDRIFSCRDVLPGDQARRGRSHPGRRQSAIDTRMDTA
jgi:hypothetical protein